MDTKKRFSKDPQAVLDYAFDWNAWLESGETISDFDLTSSPGITIDQVKSSQANGIVTAWLEDGTDQRNYDVTCHIVTSLDREDDRTVIIEVRHR